MTGKDICLIGALLAVTFTAAGQTGKPAGANKPAAPSATQSSNSPVRRPETDHPPLAVPASTTAASTADCPGGDCDYPTPHIAIATPAPAAAPWPWQDRIEWAAKIVLAILGYVGILLAISLLRKIERQSNYMEKTAETAAECAQAALLHAQAIVAAERPWIVIEAAPSHDVENGFTVLAVNRGRSPAYITALVDEIRIATGEEQLPPLPEYSKELAAPLESILLLPGESAGIRSFSRGELKTLCGSEEALKRVEEWREKIYLYGTVQYVNLITPSGRQIHESGWCCWYIHGRQKSGMVIAGPPAYHQHS